MSGGTRKGAGRKAIPIDLLELEKLCAMHSSDEEIAFFYGVSVQTIVSRRKRPQFAAAMHRGRAMACLKVRRAQMRLLDEGNPAMAVWLGKSLLGQKDNIAGIRLNLSPIETAHDVAKAAEEATQAMGRGDVSPAQLENVMRALDIRGRMIADVQTIQRIEKLEQRWAIPPPPLAD